MCSSDLGAGLRRWLASFGVRHFETQEPSDLEYDPQLVVVAEWRDAGALMQDHIDNAAIAAMLEGAEAGDALSYPWYQLPVARLAKAYSWLLGGRRPDSPGSRGTRPPTGFSSTCPGPPPRRCAGRLGPRTFSARLLPSGASSHAQR